MLSLRQLFEAITQRRAEGPMDQPRAYVDSRMIQLKRDRARGRMSQVAFTQAQAAAQKAKNNTKTGSQQYPV